MDTADEGRARTASGWDLAGFRGFSAFLRLASAHVPGGRLIATDGLTAAIAPAAADRSIFNSVLYESTVVLEAAYLDLVAAYEEAGVRAWTVWAPESDRDGLALLESRGHAFDGAPRMMALEDLATLGPAPELEVERDFDWKLTTEINDLAYGYARGTYSSGFGVAPGEGMRAYGAAADGTAASTTVTLDVGADCGVYAVATLPEARGRGLAGALIHAALLDARARGCRTSTLQASRGGAPVYERLGYADVGAVTLQERRRPV